MRNARAEYSWVSQLGERESIEHAVTQFKRLANNPRQFISDLAREIGAPDPFAQPQTPPAAPDEDRPFEMPEGDLWSEDRRHRAYSETSMKKIVNELRADLTRQFDKRLQPALDYTQQATTREVVNAQREEAREVAADVVKTVKTYPHFEEIQQDVYTELRNTDPALRRRIGSPAALVMAYNKVFFTKKFPTLSQEQKNRAVVDLQRAANAGSATVATTPTPATRPALRDGDVDGLAKRIGELASAQSA